MKRMLFCFLAGAAAGALGHWYLQQEEGKRVMAEARETVAMGAGRAKDVVAHGVDELKEELSRTGRVIRDKARGVGQGTTNATAGTPTTIAAAVQTRLATDPNLSAQSIQVDATNGVVTLSGDVANYEQIAKAMRIALETENVQKVISLLRVSSSK